MVKNCFKDTKLITTDSFTNALIAFRDGRAEALMWDDTVLLGIATQDRTLKLTNDTFLALPYGIGMKQGNTALKRWVDSRLEVMRKGHVQHDPQEQRPGTRVPDVPEEHPPPDNRFGYTQGTLRPCARSAFDCASRGGR